MKAHTLIEQKDSRVRKTKKEVVRYSWDGRVIGSVKFHASSVELIYFDCIYFIPLSYPLTDVEGSTTRHPDNWKYNTIGRWLVTGEELL